MSLLDVDAGGPRPPHVAGRSLADVLEDVGALVGSLVPGALVLYAFLIWPLAFADSSVSPIEEQLGWMAPPLASPPDSPLKQIAYPALFLLSVAALLATGAYRRLPLLRIDMLAILGMVALAAASVAWSDMPSVSLMRAAVLALIVLTIVFSVYAAGSFRLMMTAIFAALVLTAAANLAAIVLLPAGPIGHVGINAQKNVFGMIAAIVLFFGLANLFVGSWMRRGLALGLVALAPLFLVVSMSKTSLGLAFLAPVLAVGLLLLARGPRLSPAIVVPVALAGGVIFFMAGEAAGLWTLPGALTAAVGDPTLTGRTDLWVFAAGLVADSPRLGWGYEAVWGLGPGSLAHENTLGFGRVAPTGHNGYVDIALYLGAAGIVGLTLAILCALAAAGRLARVDAVHGFLALSVMVFALFHNLLESDLYVSSNHVSMLFLIFHVAALRRAG